MAKHLEVTAKYLFEQRILAYRISGSTYWMEPVIQLKSNTTCPFLVRDFNTTEKLICSIYDARPFTCRIFPLKYDPDNDLFLRGEKGEKRCTGCVHETTQIPLQEYLDQAEIGNKSSEFTEYRNLVEELSLKGYNLKELKNKKEKQKVFFAIQALLYETYPTENCEAVYPWEEIQKTILEMV
jgi:Fe-S-cluster containining protein